MTIAHLSTSAENRPTSAGDLARCILWVLGHSMGARRGKFSNEPLIYGVQNRGRQRIDNTVVVQVHRPLGRVRFFHARIVKITRL